MGYPWIGRYDQVFRFHPLPGKLPKAGPEAQGLRSPWAMPEGTAGLAIQRTAGFGLPGNPAVFSCDDAKCYLPLIDRLLKVTEGTLAR